MFAPVLYGRTLKVDFRLMAIPSFLSSEDRQWVELAVAAATRQPRGLKLNGRRQALFCNERVVVLGIAAMSEELAGDGDEISRQGSRELFGFFGYAALRSGVMKLPSFEALNAQTFSWHLANMRMHWNDEPFFQRERLCSLSEPDTEMPEGSLDDLTASGTLNFDLGKCAIFQDSHSTRRDLWIQFAKEIPRRSGTASLYLGLDSVKHYTHYPEDPRGPFILNCTTVDHHGSHSLRTLLPKGEQVSTEGQRPSSPEDRDPKSSAGLGESSTSTSDSSPPSANDRSSRSQGKLIGWLLVLASPVVMSMNRVGGALLAVGGCILLVTKASMGSGRAGNTPSAPASPSAAKGPIDLRTAYGYKKDAQAARAEKTEWR